MQRLGLTDRRLRPRSWAGRETALARVRFLLQGEGGAPPA